MDNDRNGVVNESEFRDMVMKMDPNKNLNRYVFFFDNNNNHKQQREREREREGHTNVKTYFGFFVVLFFFTKQHGSNFYDGGPLQQSTHYIFRSGGCVECGVGDNDDEKANGSIRRRGN